MYIRLIKNTLDKKLDVFYCDQNITKNRHLIELMFNKVYYVLVLIKSTFKYYVSLMYFVFNVETRPESYADFYFEKGIFGTGHRFVGGFHATFLKKKKKFILFRHLRNCR